MTNYTTIAGDMWDGITYKTLGRENYMDQVMKANPQYRHLVVFPAGITLVIPEVKAKPETSLPPWKRGVTR